MTHGKTKQSECGSNTDSSPSACSQNLVLIMSSKQIRANWDRIKADPDNPRPDLDCEEWIAEAKTEKMVALGAKVIVQDSLV